MNASELAAARHRLGLTPDQLAAELGVPPHAYRACEAGRATLPRRETRMLAHLLATADRDEALAASGLPECAWIDAWHRRAPAADAPPDARLRYFEEVGAHASSCPVCQARVRFVRERFPDLPEPPLPTGMRLMARARDWLAERPAWLRPSLVGAALLAALVALRALLALPTVARSPGALAGALAAVPLAALAGAAGGVVYTLVGRPLLGVPVVGPYLAGTATVAGYLLAIAATTWVGGEPLLDAMPSGRDATAFAILSVVLGVMLGWTLLRHLPRDRDGR